MNLGLYIKQRRILLGLTLEELAEATGTSKGYIHTLEKGTAIPGFMLAIRISVALGVGIQSMAAGALSALDEPKEVVSPTSDHPSLIPIQSGGTKFKPKKRCYYCGSYSCHNSACMKAV